MSNPLRIVRLTAENVKRIHAIELILDPDKNLVVISGRNGQGKTSLLDSILLALSGGKAGREIAMPIRDGEERASVEIDFDDFVVTKTWAKGDKPKLVVMAKDGASYRSPQAFLDERMGALSFDPLAFTRKSDRDQLAQLLELVTLPFDPLELQAERDAIFGRRTEVGRTVTALQGQLAGIKLDNEDEIPDTELSTGAILDQLAEAEALARANAGVRDMATQLQQSAHEAELGVVAAERELTEAKERLAVAQAQAISADERVATLPDVPDPSTFHDALRNAEATNALVRAKHDKRAVAHRVSDAIDAQAQLTRELDAIDARKAKALAEAEMPIEGLAFDDTGVTYNGIPFAQCSGAEQLRVSTAMAMALNPTIRIIRITDGSLLDSNNMAVLEEMAGDRGFQVFIERVADAGGLGYVIEDGSLVQ